MLVQYEKLLLALRNSVLSEDDILLMRTNYKNNPYVEPEVLEPSTFFIFSIGN